MGSFARVGCTRWTGPVCRGLVVLFLFGLLLPAPQPVSAASPGGPILAETGAEEPSFFWQLVRNIFTGDSRGLMETLGQPEYTIAAFVALNLIVFIETGLLVGFCLPGDSLLVTAGLISSNPLCDWPLWLLLLTLCVSAIVGDSVGYSIGYKTGPKIFRRENSFFFHKDHLLKAQRFYEVHGGKTIILARFIPILRTFAPVVAGVGRMSYRKFLFFNVFGGVGWVVSMVLIGYFLPSVINPTLQPIFGPQFQVQDHIEKVIIVVVLLSISPGLVVWVRNKLKRKPTEQPALAEQ